YQVTVNSAVLNANSLVRPPNPPPRVGNQYAVVNFTLTNVAGDPDPAGFFWYAGADQMEAEGPRNGLYEPDTSCHPPPPDLGYPSWLDLGQTVTGNICYEIASDGARSVLLTGVAAVGDFLAERRVWFALR